MRWRAAARKRRATRRYRPNRFGPCCGTAGLSEAHWSAPTCRRDCPPTTDGRGSPIGCSPSPIRRCRRMRHRSPPPTRPRPPDPEHPGRATRRAPGGACGPGRVARCCLPGRPESGRPSLRDDRNYPCNYPLVISESAATDFGQTCDLCQAFCGQIPMLCPQRAANALVDPLGSPQNSTHGSRPVSQRAPSAPDRFASPRPLRTHRAERVCRMFAQEPARAIAGAQSPYQVSPSIHSAFTYCRLYTICKSREK